MKKVYLEVTSDYEYVFEETYIDPINFNRSDEDMTGKPAVCAILVWWREGDLCDDSRQVNFNEFEFIGKHIHNLQEGVYYYNGDLSIDEVIKELTDAEYEVECELEHEEE